VVVIDVYIEFNIFCYRKIYLTLGFLHTVMFVYIVVDVPMCLFATFKEFVCSLLKTFRIIIYCQPHSVFSFG